MRMRQIHRRFMHRRLSLYDVHTIEMAVMIATVSGPPRGRGRITRWSNAQTILVFGSDNPILPM